MDNEYTNTTPQSDAPGKAYFVGFALFIAASVILCVWAYLSLALDRS